MSLFSRLHWFPFLAVSVLCLALAGDLQASAPGKGMLLVAAERLADPRFHEGVILLIQHDAQGTAGLVINRPSSLPLTKVLGSDTHLGGEGAALSYGGPVEAEALLVLVKVRNHPPDPAEEVIGGLYVTAVDVLEEWAEFDDQVTGFRVFTGYAGWAPGQLDLEMRRGDWQVMSAGEQDVFAGDQGGLWERLRKGPAVAD